MKVTPSDVIKEKLPKRISRLEELAYNYWWTWHRPARDLFKAVDHTLWITTRHNAVRILRDVPAENLTKLAEDPAFLRQYDSVIMALDHDIENGHLWYSKTYPELKDHPVAYFSAEFGVHTSLPIYSGGLGVLSGDHTKETSDLGIPFVGIGFLYEQGYFRQHMDHNGWQEAVYPSLRAEEVALRPVLCEDGTCRNVFVDVGQRKIHLQVWEVKVGRATLYLMDSNLEQNAPWDRELTARLYGGDQEMRLQQEILLGIGGVHIVRALGMEPGVWHLNEGHSAFLVLERLREYVDEGFSFDEAVERVRATTVFTTHTPVPAGHDTFSFNMMDKYFQEFWQKIEISRDQFMGLGSHNSGFGGSAFNMTALALRMAGKSNGVSKLHGEVSRDMWQPLWPENEDADDVPIGDVTNGVHLPSWTGSAIHHLYRKYVSPEWMARQDEATLWTRVEEVPDAVLWQAHQHLKMKLFTIMRERARDSRVAQSSSPDQLLASGIFLDPDALVIGFARRFATYKRASLIFRDIDRLKRLIHHRYCPIQIIFAGKAHPADDPAKHLLQEIYNRARSPEMGGRIAFVEDYDMHIARYLVQGVDVWLNTPRKPMEASGTSGMKAAFNGVLNLSVPDGWWAEAYNGRNGWAIRSEQQYDNEWEQDQADAEALYRILEEEVIPLYYQQDRDGVPRGWVNMMKESIRTVGPQFSTRRMVKEYTEQYYVQAIKNAMDLMEE